MIEVGRPGYAPGGAPSFLDSPRKEGKRRRPHCPCPLRCATGQPAMLSLGVRPQNSLRCFAAPFKQLRPVRARSLDILRCPSAPRPLRFSARTEGRRFGPSLRSALWPSPLPSPRGRGGKPRARYGGLPLLPSPPPRFGLSLSKPRAALRQAQRERAWVTIAQPNTSNQTHLSQARSARAFEAERSDGPYGPHPLLDAPGAGCWRGGTCTEGCTCFVL